MAKYLVIVESPAKVKTIKKFLGANYEADTILVMNDGKIIEQGNHNQLLANKGFYYELYNNQFSSVNS